MDFVIRISPIFTHGRSGSSFTAHRMKFKAYLQRKSETAKLVINYKQISYRYIKIHICDVYFHPYNVKAIV